MFYHLIFSKLKGALFEKHHTFFFFNKCYTLLQLPHTILLSIQPVSNNGKKHKTHPGKIKKTLWFCMKYHSIIGLCTRTWMFLRSCKSLLTISDSQVRLLNLSRGSYDFCCRALFKFQGCSKSPPSKSLRPNLSNIDHSAMFENCSINVEFVSISIYKNVCSE